MHGIKRRKKVVPSKSNGGAIRKRLLSFPAIFNAILKYGL